MNHFLLLINFINLLPLQVILPLCFAIALLFFQSIRLSNALTIAFLGITFLISGLILLSFSANHISTIRYFFGGYQPYVGIEYRATADNAVVLVLISFVSLISFIWGKELLLKEVRRDKIYLFNMLYLIFTAGLLGVVITNDLFNIFIFLELSSIASYALIALNKTSYQAPVAAFNYLILGSVASCLYVLGVGFIYMVTGNLNITVVINQLQALHNSLPLLFAAIFIMVFILIKAGVFPFNFWLPKTYNAAPFTFTAALSGSGSKIIIFAFFKIFVILIPTLSNAEALTFHWLLIILAVLTIAVGSIFALFKNDIKNILAWSSVTYIGYIGLAILILSKNGLIAVLLLMVAHSITKVGLFMVVGNIKYMLGSSKLKDTAYLINKSLFNFVAFLILGLSIIGFPGTIGFIAKWYLIVNLLHQHQILAVCIVIISSGLSVIYIWRVLENMIFDHKEKESSVAPKRKLPPALSMNFSIIIMIIINLGLGLFSTKLIHF